MAKFAIIADSASDLTKNLRERFDVPDVVRGLIYFPDGHSEPSDLDWEKYDPKTFYDSMSDRKTLYKTAYPPAGDIMEAMEKHLKEGRDVLCLTLSGGLSGTWQSFEMVRQELEERYPERRIICIDTLRYSYGIVLLAMLADQKRKKGATIEETAAFIEEIKHCVHQIGPMDDLYFLVKTGRITNFKAFFGTLVGINPMADFSRQGIAQVLGKSKGKKAAFDAVIKYIRQTAVNPEEQVMIVAHTNRPAAAKALRDLVEKELHPKEIILGQVGMSCGCSTGPGLCTVFYLGKETTEGLAEETAIMESILKEQGKK